MEVCFQKKKLLNYVTTILVCFPLPGCVDEVVDSQENYQEYRCDVHFLQCHRFSATHFVNGGGVC